VDAAPRSPLFRTCSRDAPRALVSALNLRPPLSIAHTGRVSASRPPWYTPAGFLAAVLTILTHAVFFLRTLVSQDAADEYRTWRLGRGGGSGGGGSGGRPGGGRGGGRIVGLGNLKSVGAVPGGCRSCAGG
jgi:hypothetical protein